MKLGAHTNSGNIELGDQGTAGLDRGAPNAGRALGHPDPQELRSLPHGACGALFNAPLLARDERTMSPCMLAKGHTEKHENAKGVSWGTRGQVRRSVPTTPPTTRGGTYTVPGRTDAERKALLQRHSDRILDQRDTSTSTSATARYEPRGPIADAKRAVRLASSPSNDWLPSQLSVIIDQLDQAARGLVQYAEARGRTNHRAQGQLVTGLVLAARTSLAGTANISGQRQATETLRRAVADLIEPLAEQQRFAQMEASLLTSPHPRPARSLSARETHPWFPGHSAT